MSRYRERKSSQPDYGEAEIYSGRYAQCLDIGTYTNPYYITTADFNFGCGYRRKQWISDEVSPKGQRPFNPCSSGMAEASFSDLTANGYIGGAAASNARWTWRCPLIMYEDARVVDPQWNPLISDLAAQIRSRLPKGSQFMVTLAELGKTIRMVKNPFGLLKSDWRERAGDLSAATLAKKGSSLWLEGRYGWTPLFLDMRSLADSWRNYNDYTSPITPEAENGRFSRSVQFMVGSPTLLGMTEAQRNDNIYQYWLMSHGTSPHFGLGNYPTVGIDISPKLVTCNVGCKAKLLADRIQNKAAAAIKALNCNVSDLLPTLWELTPYSFVVDWFFDLRGLAGILGDLRTLHSADCSDLGYSIKAETTYKVFCSMDYYGIWSCFGWLGIFNPNTGVWSYNSSVGRLKTYSRVVDLPSISLNDFFSTDLSAIHKADGIGLLVQKFLR